METVQRKRKKNSTFVGRNKKKNTGTKGHI